MNRVADYCDRTYSPHAWGDYVEEMESIFKIEFATNIDSKFENELTEEEYNNPFAIDPEHFKAKDGTIYKGKYLFYLSIDENCNGCNNRHGLRDCCIRKTKIVKARW